MPVLTCKYLIISCIDFRIQSLVSEWIHKKFPQELYDYAAFAGGVKNVVFAQEQIAIAKRLHNIQQVILIAHEDCGAYGNIEDVREIQRQDLQTAKETIKQSYPELEVYRYYLHVSGVFEEVKG